MSHVDRIDCSIKDLDALKKAVADLHGDFREGQNTFKTYGSSRPRCDHAISHPDANYEVGVKKNGEEFGLLLPEQE